MRRAGTRAPRYRYNWILFATILASGMAFLAGTTTSIALPTVQAAFGAELAAIQWVVNAYVLTLAVFILVAGSLGDHYGRKRIFSAGIATFILGSLLSALARSVGQLIAFQAVQGIGAAMMIPGSLAIINACFPVEHRGRAIGLWAGLAGGVAALGPFVGGALVQSFGWQAVFFLNVPVGVLAFLAVRLFIPESRNADARSIDWPGALLLVVGLFGLSHALIRGPVVGWTDPVVLVCVLGGALAFGLVRVVTERARDPIVPFQMFRDPLVAGANLVTLFLYFALNGVFFFFVLNLQQVQGFTPLAAGMSMLPPIVLISFLSGPFGGLADRIGPRVPMIVGPLVVAFGIGSFVFSDVGSNFFTVFLPGLVLFGLGMSLVIAPLTKSALMVGRRYSGVASGVNNAVSRIAALLAVAILGAIVVSLFTGRLESTVASAALSPRQRVQITDQAARLAAIEIPDTFDPAAAAAATIAVKQSFVYGFRWAMGVSATLALLAAFVAAATIPPGRHREEV